MSLKLSKLISFLICSVMIGRPAKAQMVNYSELKVFESCIDELQQEIKRAKAVIIKDFKLKIRQKDILAYGPYNVDDQYFKVDYVILAPQASQVTVEFDLIVDDEGMCQEVRFNDYIY